MADAGEERQGVGEGAFEMMEGWGGRSVHGALPEGRPSRHAVHCPRYVRFSHRRHHPHL